MFNNLKTVLLLGILTGLLLFIGGLFGGKAGLTIALGLAFLMNFFSYWFCHKIVLFFYRAKEAPQSKYSRLHAVVAEIAHKANIPKPKVYILPSDVLNAFATGRNPKHAVVAVTQGILSALSERELKGVLAHEIGHVKNRDILISSIAAVIAGAISYLATMAQWAAIFGGFQRDEESGHNLIGLLVMAILAPLIAMLIHTAVSRSREYEADKTGAHLLKDSSGLSDALVKLEYSARHKTLAFGNESTAHMFIVNPFSGRALMTLFSTHPSTEDRVKRLKEMRF